MIVGQVKLTAIPVVGIFTTDIQLPCAVVAP